MRSDQRAGFTSIMIVASCAWLATAQDPVRIDTGLSDARPTAAELGQDLHASGFKGVTPGESTIDQVETLLGEPTSKQSQGNNHTFTYQIGPFPKVEVHTQDDLVTSIVIHLAHPLAHEDVVSELGLKDFQPVPIRADSGERLGEVFPERGVLFSYAPGGSRRVTHLVLERISAEPFWLRIENSDEGALQDQITALRHVLELEPDNAKAHWRLATLLSRIGELEDALQAATDAHDLELDNVRYALTRAQLLGEAGDHEAATALAKEALLGAKDPLVQARAECMLGDLLATAPVVAYRDAITHHLAAVKLATPWASHQDVKVRREAKLILIDAHLGVAYNIAHGPWKQKQEVVPQWLQSAKDLAVHVTREGADASWQLIAWRRCLDLYAVINDHDSAAPLFASAERLGERLLASSDDALLRQFIEWELARAAFRMMRLEHSRAHYEGAIKHGAQAVAWVESQSPQRHASAAARYLIGNLYFYMGAIQAVDRQDHEAAVRFYERALPFLTQDETPVTDRGVQGERFVSMGVSYWETGVENEGLELTQRGMELMQEASRAGNLEERMLAVPFGNLAAMYRKLGREAEAREYAARAARLEGPRSRTR